MATLYRRTASGKHAAFCQKEMHQGLFSGTLHISVKYFVVLHKYMVLLRLELFE